MNPELYPLRWMAAQLTNHCCAGNALATACGSVGSPFAASLASPRPWSPEDPHLYDVHVALRAPGDDTSCRELGSKLWEEVNDQQGCGLVVAYRLQGPGECIGG